MRIAQLGFGTNPVTSGPVNNSVSSLRSSPSFTMKSPVMIGWIHLKLQLCEKNSYCMHFLGYPVYPGSWVNKDFPSRGNKLTIPLHKLKRNIIFHLQTRVIFNYWTIKHSFFCITHIFGRYPLPGKIIGTEIRWQDIRQNDYPYSFLILNAEFSLPRNVSLLSQLCWIEFNFVYKMQNPGTYEAVVESNFAHYSVILNKNITIPNKKL